MKKFYLISAAFVLGLLLSSPVYAISTETRNSQNSDGTPKFADPDEQKPAFMIGGGNGQGYATSQSSGFSNVTIPAVGDTTSGARAFNESLSRQQNR